MSISTYEQDLVFSLVQHELLPLTLEAIQAETQMGRFFTKVCGSIAAGVLLERLYLSPCSAYAAESKDLVLYGYKPFEEWTGASELEYEFAKSALLSLGFLASESKWAYSHYEQYKSLGDTVFRVDRSAVAKALNRIAIEDSHPNLPIFFESMTMQKDCRAAFFPNNASSANVKPLTGQAGIYFLFFENQVVYVGQSKSCIASRIKNHRKDKEFTHYSYIPVNQHQYLNDVEDFYISEYQPKYNGGMVLRRSGEARSMPPIEYVFDPKESLLSIIDGQGEG
jgi:hypothetical protein